MASPADKSVTLRVGVWNLERATTYSRIGAAQADHIVRADADIWILSEAPADLRLRKGNVLAGPSRRGDKAQCWCAVASRWPLVPLRVRHPTLLLAVVRHPEANILAAVSVLPWRSAGDAWPVGPDTPFAERFSECLASHSAEIEQASHGYRLLWGGDFNQGLSGREHVGSLSGRALLKSAFDDLGLVPMTTAAAGWAAGAHAIDHLAVPEDWVLESLLVERPAFTGLELSDHPACVVTVTGPLAAVRAGG